MSMKRTEYLEAVYDILYPAYDDARQWTDENANRLCEQAKLHTSEVMLVAVRNFYNSRRPLKFFFDNLPGNLPKAAIGSGLTIHDPAADALRAKADRNHENMGDWTAARLALTPEEEAECVRGFEALKKRAQGVRG